jgi:hypothetical protein
VSERGKYYYEMRAVASHLPKLVAFYHHHHHHHHLNHQSHEYHYHEYNVKYMGLDEDTLAVAVVASLGLGSEVPSPQ